MRIQHAWPWSRLVAAMLASTAAFLAPGCATAFEIDSGNPDVAMRWDNTLRYSLGQRMQAQDTAILKNSSYDDSDMKFKKNDIVMNRINVYSEFDFIYKNNSGFRVSGQAWYDNAYRGGPVTNPLFDTPAGTNTSAPYSGNAYTSSVKRWNQGLSGEFLDAFIFTKFNAGDIPVNVKLGSHNVYWGESLFSFIHGVSYSQGPVDMRKAFTTPGLEAKELFRPLNQFSFSSQVTDEVSVAGQYYLDYKPVTMPDGGTYFGVIDALVTNGNTWLVNPATLPGPFPKAVPFVGAYNAPKKSGEWGLMSKWSPEWLGGTMGLYYRKYTDKFPQIVLGGFQLPAPVPTSMGLSYLEDASLWGVSLSKSIGGVAFGGELTHRHNTGLLMSSTTTFGNEPRGDTWHGLLNAVAYIGKNAVFDSATFMGELAYSRLDKVSKNPTNFNSVDFGTACMAAANKAGCATKDAYGLAVKFEPTWFQVFPSMNLSMPMFYSVGQRGNSPALFGGYEGSKNYSLGLSLLAYNKHKFDLTYIGSNTRHTVDATGKAANINGIGALWDRDYLSFTYKTTF